MIETAMIFALGFLVAGLLALLVLPALNARAERLAKRRVEALLPLSAEEFGAEKDHLRAEFAVLQRRLERRADGALATRRADMEELGRRAVRIEALGGEMADRDARIEALEADLAATRGTLAATEGGLATARDALADTRAALDALEPVHRETLDEGARLRGEVATGAAALADLRGEFEAAREALSVGEAALVELRRRHGDLEGEFDARRIAISDLETRLATHTARGDDFERALAGRHSELGEERRRLVELATSLAAEQERALGLEGRLREAEAALAARPGGGGPEELELRRRIAEIADRFLADVEGRPDAGPRSTVAVAS